MTSYLGKLLLDFLLLFKFSRKIKSCCMMNFLKSEAKQDSLIKNAPRRRVLARELLPFTGGT